MNTVRRWLEGAHAAASGLVFPGRPSGAAADLVLRLHHHGSRRKNGFLGTEVYHLWHEEHSRAGEAANRERVVARMKSGIIRAETGLAEALHTSDTVVTELNR